MFEELLIKIKGDLIKFLLNLNIVLPVKEEKEVGVDTSQSTKEEKKVGRNDKCPCGSGKKFKHCHGNI